MSHLPSNQRAFSLLEISIVLVLVGLLIGAISLGQSVIRGAQLRGVATEQERIANATMLFMNEFAGFPGDLRNATEYWGLSAAGAACATTPGVGTTTCDGNGDGLIGPSDTSNESFRFWQHLSNAGLIDGKFSGVQDGAAQFGSTAKNVPTSKLPSGAWFVFNWGSQSNSDLFFDGDYTNAMSLGGIVSGNDPSANLLEPSEAFNIDTKVDDGRPGLGRVRSIWPDCTGASAGAQGTTATYALQHSDIRCRLFVMSITTPVAAAGGPSGSIVHGG